MGDQAIDTTLNIIEQTQTDTRFRIEQAAVPKQAINQPIKSPKPHSYHSAESYYY